MTYFPGIADEEFIRGDIPMTKQEIRILVLAKAKISATDVVIDIGAGTGSLSIEAALQAPQGQVFAIERYAEGIELIGANAAKFGATNLKAIAGLAPEALEGLPACDVIFIGGSGGHLAEILVQGDGLLRDKGRIVITAITIETLYDALHIMEANPNYEVEAFGAQISRIRQLKRSNMLQALNPIYVIVCTKK